MESEDLWIEILKRLPVKSVCRLRCVSKSWNSLLSSELFISVHYDFAFSQQTHKKPYLITNFVQRRRNNQCAMYFPPETIFSEYVSYIYTPYAVDDPTRAESECICYSTVGIIRGLICLASRSNVIVWNPATGTTLCRRYRRSRKGPAGQVGFGFDAGKKDFKVVAVSDTSPQRYDVLSVRDGRWRRNSSVTLDRCRVVSNACFLKGSIYWIAEEKEALVLLSFECEEEVFKMIPVWWELDVLMDNGKLFLYKGDRLAVVTTPREDSLACEVWAMELASGVWEKVCSIPGFYDNKLYTDRFGNELMRVHPLSGQIYQQSLFMLNQQQQQHTSTTPLDCTYCLPFNDPLSAFFS